MAQALEAENEKNRGKKITEFDEVGLPVHFDLSADFADGGGGHKKAQKAQKRFDWYE